MLILQRRRKMHKLYVIIRDDLSGPQKAVQGGHALAQYLIEHPDAKWTNGTLIYLTVRNLQMLNFWREKCIANGLSISVFREPDLNNEMTAFACLSDNGIFKKLKLLK